MLADWQVLAIGYVSAEITGGDGDLQLQTAAILFHKIECGKKVHPLIIPLVPIIPLNFTKSNIFSAITLCCSTISFERSMY